MGVSRVDIENEEEPWCYVLVYKNDSADKEARREEFEKYLKEKGLEIKDVNKTTENSLVRQVHIRATNDALCKYADALKIRCFLNEDYQEKIKSSEHNSFWKELGDYITERFEPDRTVFPKRDHRVTVEFQKNRKYLFSNVSNPEECDWSKVFNQSDQIMIINYILETLVYESRVKNYEGNKMSFQKLKEAAVYETDYPIHDPNATKTGKDVKNLLTEWADYKNFTKNQPIDGIKEYFGVKIALYFAWLGFYTDMLIPVSIIGIICFLYGIITIPYDPLSKVICDPKENRPMCPRCDVTCDYWNLNDACFYSKITHTFDNYATLIFAVIMSLWSAFYINRWEDYSYRLVHRWGLLDMSPDKYFSRPQYLKRVQDLRQNKQLKLEPKSGPTKFQIFKSKIEKFLKVISCGKWCSPGNMSAGSTSPGNTSGGNTSPETTSPGTTSPGTTSLGNTAGGNTSPGNTSAGNTSAGDTSPGNTSAGNTSPGNTSAGDTSPGNTLAGNTSPGNTSAGNTSVDSEKKRELSDSDIRNKHIPWRVKLPINILSVTCALFAIAILLAVFIIISVFRMSNFMSDEFYKRNKNFYNSDFKNLVVPATAGILDLICILILNKGYRHLAIWLTNKEYHRTQSEFEDSVTLKIFTFQFINYYAGFFYIAFFKGMIVGRPGGYYRFFGQRLEECNPGGCLFELCIQLATVMVGNQIWETFEEYGIPLIVRRWKAGGYAEENSNISYKDIADYSKEEWDETGLFDEYIEMVIQYGFVTLFVIAFPLAPFFALINNLFEIRGDAMKFLKTLRRPVPQTVKNVGVWLKIIDFITKLAVISNAFIIAFTTNLIPRLVYHIEANHTEVPHFINYTLTSFNTLDFENGTGPVGSSYKAPICYYSDFRWPHDYHENAYKKSKRFWHVIAARLIFVLAYTYLIKLLKIVLHFILPSSKDKFKKQIIDEQWRLCEIVTKYESLDKEKKENGGEKLENNKAIPENQEKKPLLGIMTE